MFAAITDRLSILKTNAIKSYRIETAYFFENWASIASTVIYSITTLLFIKILYANVNTFAGYTENEMIFFIFIGQINFYTDWIWNSNNLLSLIDSVRKGDLDLILAKPIPALFYVTFRDISLINRLKDSVPNLILIGMLINWTALNTSLDKILIGFTIFILGQIAWHCFRFLFVLPVFFMGQSKELFQLSGTLGNTNDIPLEGFVGSLKNIFTCLIPTLLAAHVCVSVILGKSNAIQMFLITFVVTTVFLILKQLGWIISLRHYSSATS